MNAERSGHGGDLGGAVGAAARRDHQTARGSTAPVRRAPCKGYTVHVDWSAVGLPILAFILVRTTGRCAPTAEIAAVAERSAFIEESTVTTVTSASW